MKLQCSYEFRGGGDRGIGILPMELEGMFQTEFRLRIHARDAHATLQEKLFTPVVHRDAKRDLYSNET